VVLTNPSCDAWLGWCWLLRWLADWLDVKMDMQAVFVIGLTRSWSARDKQG